MSCIKSFIIKAMAALVVAIIASVPSFAQKEGLRVTGTVVDANGLPIEGVAVTDMAGEKSYGTTDAFGAYEAIVPADGSLKFSRLGYRETLVAVKGRLQINVTMPNDVIEIEEVVVAAKAKRKLIVPEPTDIEVKGNYFHLRTRFSIPARLFKSGTRLVAQPSVYNVDSGERLYMRPLVVDGRAYNVTQERMYDFDPSRDPLNDYVSVKEGGYARAELMPYRDSIYVSRINDDYRADVVLALEDYNRVIYTDTFTIARGTVNPLRLLDYDLQGREFNDSAYIPRATMQLMDSHGEVNLTFVINSDAIDPDDPGNAAELRKLSDELRAIEADDEASLRSLFVTGLSSPDGRYAYNLSLARKRTETALNSILAMLGQSTRATIDKGSSAEVQGWEAVSLMLRNDSLFDEARAVDEVIAAYADRDTRSRRMTQLPFYRPLLAEDYLPRLRKVEYTYEYSILRYKTDDEIRELYAADHKQLTASEWHRLIFMTTDDSARIVRCRQALERFPKFLIAANELSRLLLRSGRPDCSVLEPFVNEDAPQEVIYNQALCQRTDNRINDALATADLLADNDGNALIKAIIAARAGYFDEAFGVIAATGDLNEAIILLAMGRNDEAWAKAKTLDSGTAKECYVKAIAANRMDNLTDALVFMQQAFALDPSLEEYAKTDGDLIDLLPDGQVRE